MDNISHKLAKRHRSHLLAPPIYRRYQVQNAGGGGEGASLFFSRPVKPQEISERQRQEQNNITPIPLGDGGVKGKDPQELLPPTFENTGGQGLIPPTLDRSGSFVDNTGALRPPTLRPPTLRQGIEDRSSTMTPPSLDNMGRLSREESSVELVAQPLEGGGAASFERVATVRPPRPPINRGIPEPARTGGFTEFGDPIEDRVIPNPILDDKRIWDDLGTLPVPSDSITATTATLGKSPATLRTATDAARAPPFETTAVGSVPENQFVRSVASTDAGVAPIGIGSTQSSSLISINSTAPSRLSVESEGTGAFASRSRVSQRTATDYTEGTEGDFARIANRRILTESTNDALDATRFSDRMGQLGARLEAHIGGIPMMSRANTQYSGYSAPSQTATVGGAETAATATADVAEGGELLEGAELLAL